MLYKFKSKAAGDVIMTAAVGDKVLRAMGREPSSQGILAAGSLGSLLGTLESAIADETARPDEASANAAGMESSVSAGPGREGVSLKQRAWPLIEMMRRAATENVDIVWGV